MKDNRQYQDDEEEKLNIFARTYKFISRYFDELSLLFLAGFLYYVASNTQSGWLYFVVAIIAGTLTLSFILSYQNLRKLRITRKFSETNFEDGKTKVQLTIINDSRLPKFMLLIEDKFPSIDPDEKNEKILVPYIEGKGKITITYEQRCYKRGVFRFGRIVIESYGLLSFFYMKKKFVAHPDKMVVFPRTYRLDHFLLNNVSPYFARQENTYNVMGRSHDFLGIREYSPGEEIRFIHWPTSAKVGKLMIKEFKEIATHSLTVVIDTNKNATFGEGRNTTTEDMYRIGATLLKVAKQKRYTFDLFARSNGKIVQDKNLSSLKGMYRLAEIESISPIMLDQDLDEISSNLNSLDHVYILKTLPFNDLEPLCRMMSKKVFVTVIFFDPLSYAGEYDENLERLKDLDYGPQIDRLKAMGINVYMYSKGSSLNSILSFRRPINVYPVS